MTKAAKNGNGHKLKLDARNARKHSERNQRIVKQSLGEVGAFRSVGADANGIIRVGNQTYQAAQDLGYKVKVVQGRPDELIVVQRADLKGKQAIRAAMLDNLSADSSYGDYDRDILAAIAADDDLVAALIAEDEHLAELLRGEPQAESADAGELVDRAAELQEKWQVKTGDLWQCGKHRIACIDSTDEKQVTHLLDGAKPTFVWNDPPYGIDAVDSKTKTLNSGNPYAFGGQKKTVGAGKPIPANHYSPTIGDKSIETATTAFRLCQKMFPKATQVWWGANHYSATLPSSSCWIVWDKREDIPQNDFADGELAWCSSGLAVRIFRHKWSGLIKASERGERRVHPNQKPVALAVWCFEKYDKANGIIFDGFLGSGISVIAAEQMNDGRCVFGCELSPDYIAVTLERWATLTGQTPKRLE